MIVTDIHTVYGDDEELLKLILNY